MCVQQRNFSGFDALTQSVNTLYLSSQLFDALEEVFFLEQEAATPNVFKTEAPEHLKFSSECLSRNLARSPNLNKEKRKKILLPSMKYQMYISQ